MGSNVAPGHLVKVNLLYEILIMSHLEDSENAIYKDNDNLNQSDINGALKETLSELKGQKRDLNSFKVGVRENSLSSGEFKKKEKDKDISWKFEGNRLEYQFNSVVEDNLKQLDWAIKHHKTDCALCTDTREKV